ncbi:MAG: sulfite exporter TauE/SafE family protein [Leptospira sp.]|nr:sulfite exporter TauE/SafE family protein [Leptospira sp.]
MEYFLYYALSGIAVGILAGLFGVGGGIIMVPILTFSFYHLGFPTEIVYHTALGSSLTCILFTSFSSMVSHAKKKAVDRKILLYLIPTVLLGTSLGARFAGELKSKELKYVFIFFIFVFSIRMLTSSLKKKLKKVPEPANNEFADSHDSEIRKLPILFHNFIGLLIGFSSALVGVGGGVFTSTYMLALRYPIHKAVGTSAAMGFPIAIAGSLSYMWIGWNHSALPKFSLGFVYLPAVAGIVLTSFPFAYLGAKFAHSLSKDTMRFIFASFLFIVGSLMVGSDFF